MKQKFFILMLGNLKNYILMKIIFLFHAIYKQNYSVDGLNI